MRKLISRSKLFGLSLAILSVGCGGGGAAAPVVPFGEGYFPRTQGGLPMTWSYRKSTSDGGVIVSSVWFVGEDVFNDRPSFVFEEASDGTPNVQRHYRITDRVQFLGIPGVGGETHSAENLFLFDMEPGSSGNYSDAITGTNPGTHQYVLSRLADEVVAVPAGTFKCAVFSQVTTGVGGEVQLAIGNVRKLWLAPGVGVVKFTDAGSLDLKYDLTTELMSYGTVSP